MGGASGVFLNQVRQTSGHPFEGTILEVNDAYRTKMVHPSLRFLEASILDNDLPDGSFDIVTFRHILHHLVGGSVQDCLALQRKAISELLRLTRPGGYVLFQEQIHFVKPFSRAVFHLSKLANRYKIRWRYFETGTVVISFLTPGELSTLVDEQCGTHGATLEKREFTRRQVQWRWRLTLLMNKVGDGLFLLKKSPNGIQESLEDG
ncbi:MAG: class I SAM-dependent methyltransferase [Acidobacteria bacterium]|nr:class I SAM-dependent methyltransferase [Acidobacteriota bacterium]